MALTGLRCSVSSLTILLLFILFSHKDATGDINSAVHRRFEYKYSFKPPYLAQKDGTVPFWEYGGNAIASSDSVRVAPSLRSQKGAIWTKSKTNFDWWEVEIVFRVTGRGRIGADGLAFWYTTEKGDYNGPVFGSSDKWVGLGLFFDSFDNDNKHNNPYIMAVLNDGTKNFDHQNDGTTQLLAGCLRDFRNKPFPTRARIEYYQNVLTVLFHNGMTNNNDDYEMCLRADGVILPKNGHFGLSAATGGLADDHDVFHFLTTSLHPPGQLPDVKKMTEDDSEKLTKEYQDYQKKLEQQKEEYRKEHPDEVKEDENDDWFESDNQRELRQIWQAQSTMTEVLRDMSRKLDEVIGRQERTMSLISVQGQQQQVVHPGQPPQPQVPGMVGSTITRPEVDMLLNNQNILLTTVREMRAFIGEIQARTDTIIHNQAKAPTAHVQTAGYDVQSIITEMRDGLNQVKQGVAHVGQRLGQPAPLSSCPTQNCVSLVTFLVVAGVQLAILLVYNIYKSRNESQAKKFY